MRGKQITHSWERSTVGGFERKDLADVWKGRTCSLLGTEDTPTSSLTSTRKSEVDWHEPSRVCAAVFVPIGWRKYLDPYWLHMWHIVTHQERLFISSCDAIDSKLWNNKALAERIKLIKGKIPKLRGVEAQGGAQGGGGSYLWNRKRRK